MDEESKQRNMSGRTRKWERINDGEYTKRITEKIDKVGDEQDKKNEEEAVTKYWRLSCDQLENNTQYELKESKNEIWRNRMRDENVKMNSSLQNGERSKIIEDWRKITRDNKK